MSAPRIYTHKETGWTRQSTADGSGRFTVTPTDDSGARIVRLLSAGSWQNDPNDDRARQDTDRAVLIEGAPLPSWAQAWLDGAAAKTFGRARESLRAALQDADDNDPAFRDW